MDKQTVVDNGGHVKNYYTLPKSSAWIVGAIFLISVLYSALLIPSQLETTAEQVQKQAIEARRIEQRLRDLETQTAVNREQYLNIMDAIAEIKTDIRELRSTHER